MIYNILLIKNKDNSKVIQVRKMALNKGGKSNNRANSALILLVILKTSPITIPINSFSPIFPARVLEMEKGKVNNNMTNNVNGAVIFCQNCK